MRYIFLIWVALFGVALTPVAGLAQDNVIEIPVEAFAGKNALQSARLSETGNRLAFVAVNGEDNVLVVRDADTLESVVAVDLGKREHFRWFRWAGDERILISTSIPGSPFGSDHTRLMSFDIPTQKLHNIGFERQGPEGDDVLHIDPQGRHVILSMSNVGFAPPAVWQFPLNGSGPDAALRVQKPEKDIHEWYADDTGVVRLGMSWTRRADMKIFYRSGPQDKFRRVTKVKSDDDAARDAWDVMGIYAGRDTGYALVDANDGRTVLREIDYANGQLGKIVFENAKWGIESTMFQRGVGPIGVSYTDDAPQTVWLDPAMAELQSKLEKALPGSSVTIIDRSGLDRMLVMQSGDADPGALYVFTPSQNRLHVVANMRPDIDHRKLATSSAHTIATRDGNSIRAFLTLPTGSDQRDLPLIIMPHGGPYGVRDALVYDDWTQLLANRGYAVLRPNFRGSGGYGEAFERLGDGQIGRAMQDDLDDAYDWAVEQGIADPDRVCLFGASYGGYAAMWGAVRNPERYRCSASFAGVTDWKQLLKYDRDYLGRGRTRKKWYKDIWTPRITGDDGFDLEQISVVAQIGRLKRPVLATHGTRDMRVPFEQFEDLKAAASDVGAPVEFLELEDDHYLSDPAEEIRMLNAILAFLEKHNPARAALSGEGHSAETEPVTD